jgi:hypothetical protein
MSAFMAHILAYVYGARGETRTRKTFRPGVFLTTSAFAALSVRGLDYAFTIAFALGAPRLVSTPSLSGLVRRWLALAGRSPSLGSSTSKVSLGALKSFQDPCVCLSATRAFMPVPAYPLLLRFLMGSLLEIHL